MFWSVLDGIFMTMFGLSAVGVALNNSSVKRRLERVGLVVSGKNVSLIEKITYFIQDYAYLLVPFYNIHKSIFKNLFKKGSITYENERKEKYLNRRMLYSINDDNTLSLIRAVSTDKDVKNNLAVTRKEAKNQRVKRVFKKMENKNTENTNTQTRNTENANTQSRNPATQRQLPPRLDEQRVEPTYSTMSLSEKYEFFNNLFNQKKAEYKKVYNDTSVPYSRKSDMYDELVLLQEEINSLKERIERQAQIDNLKAQISILEQQQGQSQSHLL